MCMMFSQCNTCSMFIYHGHAGLYDIVSMGVWPHRGPCLLHFGSQKNLPCLSSSLVCSKSENEYLPVSIPQAVWEGGGLKVM